MTKGGGFAMTEGEPLPGARGKIYFPFVCPDQYEHTNKCG